MIASTLSPAAVHTMLAAGPCLVYFTKKDGTTRRMVTAPHAEGCTAKNGIARVFDAEKGAWRSVNLRTVTDARPLAARAHVERPASPAPVRFEGKTAAEHVADIFGD